MEETLFTRIKRAVENEQAKQMRGEAKLESLQSERNRILEDATTYAKQPINNEQDLSLFLDKQKSDIQSKISEAEALLRKEGVEF